MSRVKEEFHKLDEIDINIALKVGLIIECESHPNEYYDSCGEDFDIHQSKIKQLLNSYSLTTDEYNIVLNKTKNIQDMHQDTCILCSK